MEQEPEVQELLEEERLRAVDEIRELFSMSVARALEVLEDDTKESRKLWPDIWRFAGRVLTVAVPAKRAMTVEARQQEGPLILGGHLVGAGDPPARPEASEEEIAAALAEI